MPNAVVVDLGAAYGTAKSGVGIASMGVMRPELVMRNIVPVIMAGVLGIYGLIVAVIIQGSIDVPNGKETVYGSYTGFAHLSAGLCCGLSGLAAGMAIGVVGDAGVRAVGQQEKLFVGLILILIFAEALGLYGLIKESPRFVDVALCNIAEIVLQDTRSSSAIVHTVGFTLGMTAPPEKDADDTSNTMEVACKNFEIFRFHVRVTSASMTLHTRLVERLESTHQPAPIAFAKEPLTRSEDEDKHRHPWSDLEVAESARMGLTAPSRRHNPTSGGFRVTRVNHTFRLCATYPMLLIVPQHISDSDLKSIAHFRARGRVPAITYRHEATDALVARCAQPLVGLRRRRCASDELYVKFLQQHAVGGLYIIDSATTCVDKLVEEKASLLVHCSDGWDRTAQLTALVKVCCDPYFRTVDGFALLVQQEWVSFGHRFDSRCGMKAGHRSGAKKHGYWDDEQSSPVFVQFIDAVWQMTQLAPCSFEFNDAYLIALVDEVYARRTGTFLFDCDEQRMKARTYARCPSVWSDLNLPDMANPFYIVPDDADAKSPRVLRFRWHTSTLSIWPGLYLRSLESREAVCTQSVQQTQQALQTQLQTTQHLLNTQVELNAQLQAYVSNLESKTQALNVAFQGQVFSESGVVVHESDMDDASEEEAVLLSVTQTQKKVDMFVAAAILHPFEVLPTYFDEAETRRVVQ
ncbi:hypothetical protein DYB28_001673 [Aphanomyces astaci]|uniref:Myotubularin phosphatase domain-containing protein n=1 Tax=Aphanomyces astaci TaxID=112090 RepID=A0A9X8DYN7_APHAT|nr:hypothetical protein DYB28_001673 [Aphanomyces astaci]